MHHASHEWDVTSKQERRQRLWESLPVSLRPHVSVCNIEAEAVLPTQVQAGLLEAIQTGLKRLPRAIDQLRANPPSQPVTEILIRTPISTAQPR